ncbi:MAG TPA: YicC/YloC family endoribonuclease, partial [Longimicrobiaceae bacterium]
MIRSMTGFGEARKDTPAGTLLVEVRTVNHRHFNANLRLPQALSRWEAEIREWLRAHVSRGHVNAAVRVETPAGTPRGLKLDDERVQSYLALLNQLRARFGVSGTPDLHTLARFPDVFVRDEG